MMSKDAMHSHAHCQRGTSVPTYAAPLRSFASGVLAVLLLMAGVLAAAAGQGVLQAHGYKMAGDASRMRVVLHFDREPAARWSLLRDPHRLVVDMPEAAFGFDPAELEPRGMVTEVRHGNFDQGRSRIILSFDGPFSVERFEVIENESREGYRLLADIVAGSEDAFQKAMADQIGTTGATQSTPKHDRLGAVAGAHDEGAGGARRPRVVIDAGHGGIDAGAEGASGTQEKTITLAFALELKKKLDDAGKYDVLLTRDRDLFLRLDERVRIARQQEADLFISIHADAIGIRSVRGATVYTVADKASDAEAAAKAIRENLADRIAGIEIEDEHHEVADILADLIRRETQTFSLRFAKSLVDELTSSIQMIKNPHRFAGFKVLRAPDVPSVLLELGYLSNVEDEAQLRDAGWRAGAAAAIAAAIDLFFAARQGAGG